MTLADSLDAVVARRWSAQRDGDQSTSRARRCLAWLGTRRVTQRRLEELARAAEAAGLGPASVNRHLSALSAVLAEAGIELPMPWRREPRGRTCTLDRAAVAALAARLYPPYANLVLFLAETGMRVGEALALLHTDVDEAGARIRDSKNGEPRLVPLTAVARRAWEISGPWYISRSSFQHAFRKAAQDAGMPGLRPHDLRHAAASRLTEVGVPLPTVSAWLGHRDPRSTLRYVHVTERGLQDAATRLDQVGG